MFTTLRQRARSQEGFTLVELLVVILIIGILAAIAIPSFLGQTAKANDASAKSNARNAVSAMESCFTDAQTYATPCGNASLTSAGLTVGTGKGQVNVTGNSSTGYTVTAYSNSNNEFLITNTSGTLANTCKNSGTLTNGTGKADGGCATNNGSW